MCFIEKTRCVNGGAEIRRILQFVCKVRLGTGVVKSLSLQKMMALPVLCVETFADRVDLGRGNKMITITSSDDDYVIIIR